MTAKKDIFPTTIRAFNTWLRSLPPGRRFNAMSSDRCPLARFGQSRAASGPEVRVAAPNYYVVQEGEGVRVAFRGPNWLCRVQDAAFTACAKKRQRHLARRLAGMNDANLLVSYDLTAQQLRKALES